MQKIQPKAAAFEFQDSNRPAKGPSFGQKLASLLGISWSRDKTGDNRFPYKDGLIRRVSKWLVSTNFQVGAHIVGALAFAISFVLVKELQFPESCLGAVYTFAFLILLSPHSHVGCRLASVSKLLFLAAFLGPYAGLVISLAYSTGSGHYSGSLVAFAIIGFIPIAFMRSAPGDIGPGMIAAIIYGIVLIFTIPRPENFVTVWHMEVAHMMAFVCISAAGILISTVLILPTLAGDHVQKNLAEALRGMGHSLSRYSSFIVGADEHENRQAIEKGLHHAEMETLKAQMTSPELNPSDPDFYDSMNRRTDPQAPRLKLNIASIAPTAPHASLYSKLDECKILMLEASHEPAYFQRGRFIVSEWNQVLANTRTLLTRIGAMAVFVDSGQLIHSSLLQRELGFDPMPTFSVVLGELAAAIQSLSVAISSTGTPMAAKACTKVNWSQFRTELIAEVKRCLDGYTKRHRAEKPTADEFHTLEARVLLFLVTLMQGVISSVAALETSLLTAIGLPDIINDKTSDHVSVDLGVDPERKQEDHKDSQITFKQHWAFLKPFMEMVVGVAIYRRLKPFMWDATIKAFSSWKEFKVAISRRRVQHGFKFWLCPMIGLSIVVAVQNDYVNTRSWKMYYAYVTLVVISVEKVEAVVWKTLQRIMGTLLGGTLAYLVMLRPYIRTRGIIVAVLYLTIVFVVAQKLQTQIKYTCFLTMITLSSLILCQYSSCCSPGEDFHNWKARVTNIIAAALFATAVCWFLLPWYASDDQLLHLGQAYVNAAELMDSIYNYFAMNCKKIAEGKDMSGEEAAHSKLDKDLQSKVVAHFQIAMLSLSKEGVVWKQGLLSTPPIVFRLVDEMQDLIHHLTGIELSVTCAPEEFGTYSAAAHDVFVARMDADVKELLAQVSAVAKACLPILKHGPDAELTKAVEAPLQRMRLSRREVRCHLEKLREERYRPDTTSQPLTPAEFMRFASFVMAMTRVMDKMMLIARIIIDDSYSERENIFSNVSALEGSRRNLSVHHEDPSQ